MTGWQRPVAIAGGWVLGPLLILGTVAGSLSSQHELSASDVAACLSFLRLAPSSDQPNELELAVRAGDITDIVAAMNQDLADANLQLSPDLRQAMQSFVAAPSLDLAAQIDNLCTGPLAPTPGQ